jgi:hypothetical protein
LAEWEELQDFTPTVNESETDEGKSHLLITEFSISVCRAILTDRYIESEGIVLNKGDDNFRITFARLNFKMRIRPNIVTG